MFRRTKKVTKYLAAAPLKVMGISVIRQNNQILKEQFYKLNAPVCPHCFESIMMLDESRTGVRRTYEAENPEDGNQTVELYHWVCQNPECEADELMPLDNNEARDWAKQLHNELASEKIQVMEEAEMEPYVKTHRVFARIMYACSFACILYFLYAAAFSDTSLFKLLLIYLPVSAAFFVNGMKRSYRCWQLRERRLFDEGAFKEWLGTGRWFV